MGEKIYRHEMLGSEGQMPREVAERVRSEIAGVLHYLILRKKSDGVQNEPGRQCKERDAAYKLQ